MEPPAPSMMEVWLPAEAVVELCKWKEKLRRAFGVADYDLEVVVKFTGRLIHRTSREDTDEAQVEYGEDSGRCDRRALTVLPGLSHGDRRIREVSEPEAVNVAPRLEVATHRPLGYFTSFSGLRNKSENSMQWF
ncbi:hypothetical protein JG687_00015582 [Phytophthora cactorum]|uniref:Uncharacterized protein n=1 Tax=Phytophthora cactorum TaxID=29920 RepID=A0A329RNR9_9STRA|nr:hypothetical protein Pcac1_g5989 [Phytophthora cactorum]KAG2808854.1 hypothetical protein PC112_g16774 [Phytophthora cactorum]KAG2809660.1 hypothetical protein PC111_g15972 [Phytophthora cactorum]KAG2850382.1 hypothetical protein PC113_g16838 [Phytophthora cactorum]KAG2888696.1 hypothetical protein PC114_g18311 [Phytophthora cactorum]